MSAGKRILIVDDDPDVHPYIKGYAPVARDRSHSKAISTTSAATMTQFPADVAIWTTCSVIRKMLSASNNFRLYEGRGPELVNRRPDITIEMVDKFLTKMYRTNPDFVFTVTRDFVRNCQTPVPILPDDISAHPYAVAMEATMLPPKAEVSMFPWKEPKERIPLAVRQIRSFLRAHHPASA